MARRSPDPELLVSSPRALLRRSSPVRLRIGLLVALTGCALVAGAPDAIADQGVVLRDITFQPANVTVAVGETVTWEHRDGETPHTVTSTSGPDSWDSHPTCTPPGNPVTCMTEGDTFSFTFEQAGTYQYGCKIHSSMNGTVVVEGSDASSTTTSSTTTTSTTTTTTAPPGTTAPPTTSDDRGQDAGSATSTTDPTDTDAEAVADEENGNGGGAIGLALILITLIGMAAFAVWRLRPKPALIVDAPDDPDAATE